MTTRLPFSFSPSLKSRLVSLNFSRALQPWCGTDENIFPWESFRHLVKSKMSSVNRILNERNSKNWTTRQRTNFQITVTCKTNLFSAAKVSNNVHIFQYAWHLIISTKVYVFGTTNSGKITKFCLLQIKPSKDLQNVWAWPKGPIYRYPNQDLYFTKKLGARSSEKWNLEGILLTACISSILP